MYLVLQFFEEWLHDLWKPGKMQTRRLAGESICYTR